jgi:hypothetical protein
VPIIAWSITQLPAIETEQAFIISVPRIAASPPREFEKSNDLNARASMLLPIDDNGLLMPQTLAHH